MPEPIKILFLNHSDSAGGAARAAYRLMCALRDQGYNIKMLVRDKQTNDPDVLLCFDYERKGFFKIFEKLVWKVKNRIRKQKWKRYPNREPVFLNDLDSISLIKALRSIDFDILHLHFVANRFLNLSELKKIHQPILWTLHDCWPFTGICHYFYECDNYAKKCGNCPHLHSGNENDLSHKIWKKKKKLYKDLNLRVVTPSNWLAQMAKQSSLFNQYPVMVIPNPIDTDLFTPGDKFEACKLLNLDSKNKYILYGSFNAVNDSRKGFGELIEALKLFSENYDDEDIVLLVFGADHPVNELRMKIPVKYLGVIKDDDLIDAAYRVASVTVVPSQSENLSNTIMESLSGGTPVVAFNIGGNGDMIEHQQNGYLADAFSIADLSQGIQWCLENNTDNQLSINARRKVEDNFSFEIIAGKYQNLYKSML